VTDILLEKYKQVCWSHVTGFTGFFGYYLYMPRCFETLKLSAEFLLRGPQP